MNMSFGEGFCRLLYMAVSFTCEPKHLCLVDGAKAFYKSSNTKKCTADEYDEIILAIERNKKFRAEVSCELCVIFDKDGDEKGISWYVKIKFIDEYKFISALQLLEFFGDNLFEKYKYYKYVDAPKEDFEFSYMLRRERYSDGPVYIKIYESSIYEDDVLMEIPNFTCTIEREILPRWLLTTQSYGYTIDDCKMLCINYLHDVNIVCSGDV